MSLGNNFLVPFAIREPSIQNDAESAETRLVFGSFHEVFAAERLPERAIFWMERRPGAGAILRHVRKLDRARKNEDQLVLQIPDDPDAARIVIGNFAQGCKLSTVRWELYDNFELSSLISDGRFDFMDLSSGIDPEKMVFLRELGVVPSGDWDFDCVILFHRCPVCTKLFDKQSIIYNPTKSCDSCGTKVLWEMAKKVVTHAMVGYMERMRRIAIHRSASITGEFELQHFVDPVPNSVMYWILATTQIAVLPDVDRMFGLEYEATHSDWVETMYLRSLFNFMAGATTRELFRQYMEKIHGQCEVFIGVWQGIGEMLRLPYSELRKIPLDKRLENSRNLHLVIEGFPSMINSLIVEHVNPEERDITDVD